MLINLVDRQVEVFTQPDPTSGQYAASAILKPSDDLSLSCGVKAFTVPVERLIG